MSERLRDVAETKKVDSNEPHWDSPADIGERVDGAIKDATELVAVTERVLTDNISQLVRIGVDPREKENEKYVDNTSGLIDLLTEQLAATRRFKGILEAATANPDYFKNKRAEQNRPRTRPYSGGSMNAG